MPSYSLEIPSVHEAITRPLVKHISDTILDNFNLRNDETQFIFFGNIDGNLNNNSSIHDNHKRDNVLQADQRVEIDFDEEILNPVNIALHRQENAPVFYDKRLWVWLRPIYVQCRLDLKFKLITSDQTSAAMWKRRAELQAYRQMHTFMTEVDYHYQIPLGFMKMLWVIHSLSERSLVPMNKDFGQWINEKGSKRLTALVNQAGKRTRFAIREKQARIQGQFNFLHDVSKITQDSDAGSWTTEFDVSLYYDRVDAMVMDYPYVICNQLIPKSYRDETPVNHTYPETNLSRSMSLGVMKPFEFNEGREYHVARFSQGVSVPLFDDWLPHQAVILDNHLPIVRLLIQVQNDNRRRVIRLQDEDLGDFKLKPVVKAYLGECKDLFFSPYDCMFIGGVHEWYSLIDRKSTHMSEDLMVTVKFDMLYERMYHFNVEILADLSLLSELGWSILRKYPELIRDWVSVFRPNYNPEDLNNLLRGEGGNPFRDNTKKPYNNYKGSGGHTGNNVYNGVMGTNKVNQFNIFAFREGEVDGDYDGIRGID